MAVIAVDVDFTVVDMVPVWWHWLENITNCKKDIDKTTNGQIDYDLSVYFKEELKAVNRCGLDFYRQDGLYDTIKPIQKSVEVLNKVSLAGHEIVFVSAIKGRHTKSKAEFIKRHYPFYSGIVYTKEKQYVDCEVFIDDRVNNINMSKAPLKIFLDSPVIQSDKLVVSCHTVYSWHSIGHILYKYFRIPGEN